MSEKPADATSTRERLLRAAIAIATDDGIDAVTTVSVCRRVGIAQSSYYTHFSSREALLEAMAERSAAITRRANRSARTRFGEHRDATTLRDAMRAPLELMRASPELFRLGHQARSAPAGSVLGAHGRAMAEANRRELADDLLALAGRADDPDPALRLRYEMVADCIEAMVSALGQGHLEGRYPEVEDVVDLLTIYGAGSTALAEWLRWDDAGPDDDEV